MQEGFIYADDIKMNIFCSFENFFLIFTKPEGLDVKFASQAPFYQTWNNVRRFMCIFLFFVHMYIYTQIMQFTIS